MTQILFIKHDCDFSRDFNLTKEVAYLTLTKQANYKLL